MTAPDCSGSRHETSGGAAGPLAGLRVVDMAALVAGPAAARYLGDFGADVVKVEPPAGDSARALGLAAGDNEDSYFWKLLGRNKRAVQIDLKTDDGKSRFVELIKRADVLIESMRAGKLESLGLGAEQLLQINPRLVVLRITGFGQDGPYASRPGFATLAEAMSGYAALSGSPDGPPQLPPVALTDEVAGLVGALAVMVALWERRSSGAGQVIDVNLLESILQLLGPLIPAYVGSGYLQPRLGSGLPYSVPRGVYRSADDRWIAISGSAESVARRVVDLLGVAADQRFVDHKSRSEHRTEFDSLLGKWVAERAADEVLAEFERIEGAAAVVYTVADLVADPHVRDRGSLITVDGFTMQGLAARLGRTPGAVRFAGRPLGADTDTFDDWQASG